MTVGRHPCFGRIHWEIKGPPPDAWLSVID
eukprot:COSAG02_NODE_43524_length_374_cov_0.552727_1_plen_29_part_10